MMITVTLENKTSNGLMMMFFVIVSTMIMKNIFINHKITT